MVFDKLIVFDIGLAWLVLSGEEAVEAAIHVLNGAPLFTMNVQVLPFDEPPPESRLNFYWDWTPRRTHARKL